MTADHQEDITSFSFLKEKVHGIIKNCVEKQLNDTTYNSKSVQGWVDSINQTVIDQLQPLSSNFKYIVSTSIIQRSNAGYHSSCACLWDYTTDEAVTYRAEFKTMHCVVTVYGVAL